MDKKATMTIQEASDALGIDPKTLRMGLQQKAFNFGTVVQMKEKVYIIWRSEVEKLIWKGEKLGGESCKENEVTAEGVD